MARAVGGRCPSNPAPSRSHSEQDHCQGLAPPEHDRTDKPRPPGSLLPSPSRRLRPVVGPIADPGDGVDGSAGRLKSRRQAGQRAAPTPKVSSLPPREMTGGIVIKPSGPVTPIRECSSARRRPDVEHPFPAPGQTGPLATSRRRSGAALARAASGRRSRAGPALPVHNPRANPAAPPAWRERRDSALGDAVVPSRRRSGARRGVFCRKPCPLAQPGGGAGAAAQPPIPLAH